MFILPVLLKYVLYHTEGVTVITLKILVEKISLSVASDIHLIAGMKDKAS